MTTNKLLTIDFRSFNNFVKANTEEQTKLLSDHGILLDHDCENGRKINLYFLNGFFVESVYSIAEQKVIENLPFRQGYRVSDYLEMKPTLVPKKGIFTALAAI